MIVEELSIRKDEQYLLKFLYPSYPVYQQESGFIRSNSYCIVSHIKPSAENKRVVWVHTRAKNNLTTDAGMIEYLKHKYKINQSIFDVLAAKDRQTLIDDFKWIVLGFNKPDTVKESNIFNLFKDLTFDFDRVYQLYKEIDLNYQIVASALLTMFMKVNQVDRIDVSPGYRRVLLKNKVKLAKFKKVILNYYSSNRKEIDFLEMLMELTSKG